MAMTFPFLYIVEFRIRPMNGKKRTKHFFGTGRKIIGSLWRKLLILKFLADEIFSKKGIIIHVNRTCSLWEYSEKGLVECCQPNEWAWSFLFSLAVEWVVAMVLFYRDHQTLCETLKLLPQSLGSSLLVFCFFSGPTQKMTRNVSTVDHSGKEQQDKTFVPLTYRK